MRIRAAGVAAWLGVACLLFLLARQRKDARHGLPSPSRRDRLLRVIRLW